ncbi:MAG: helix-turn-helix domain-containing protein [Solirubrobacteraceae bacterium]
MSTVHSRSRPSATRPNDGDDGRRQSRSTRPASRASGSLLFAEDVAALTGMTKDWIYAETRAGRIPHIALGRYYRYRRESIEAWLGELEHATVTLPRKAARRR